jgi:hypothetical protein
MLEQIGDEIELNTTLTNASQAQGLTVAEMIDRLGNRKNAQTIFLSVTDKWPVEKCGTAI